MGASDRGGELVQGQWMEEEMVVLMMVVEEEEGR